MSNLEEENDDLRKQIDMLAGKLQQMQIIKQGDNAQMAIMEMETRKMKDFVTNIKEQTGKKTSDRVPLFPGGLGRHTTDSGFIAQVTANQVAKEKKKTDAAERKTQRIEAATQKLLEKERKKEAREKARAEWGVALHEYKKMKEKALEDGKKVKHLPPPPRLKDFMEKVEVDLAEQHGRGEDQEGEQEDFTDVLNGVASESDDCEDE